MKILVLSHEAEELSFCRIALDSKGFRNSVLCTQSTKGIALFPYAHFDVVVCAQCGLTQFFAEPSARENLDSHKDWMPVQTPKERGNENG